MSHFGVPHVQKKTTFIADLSHGKTPTIGNKLSAPCRTRMPGRVNLAPKEICKKNTSFPKICTTKSKWIPGFTVSHGFTAFYVTTKSTNLRHGLTKLHLSIYDSKWVAGVTAVWGLVFLYSKPTCSTCLMFFPGKSLNIMEFHGFSCVFSAFFRSFSPTEPSMIGCNGIVQNCSSLAGVPGPRSFLSAALSPDGF